MRYLLPISVLFLLASGILFLVGMSHAEQAADVLRRSNERLWIDASEVLAGGVVERAQPGSRWLTEKVIPESPAKAALEATTFLAREFATKARKEESRAVRAWMHGSLACTLLAAILLAAWTASRCRHIRSKLRLRWGLVVGAALFAGLALVMNADSRLLPPGPMHEYPVRTDTPKTILAADFTRLDLDAGVERLQSEVFHASTLLPMAAAGGVLFSLLVSFASLRSRRSSVQIATHSEQGGGKNLSSMAGTSTTAG